MGRAARINAAKREKIKDMHDDSVRLSLILPDGFIDDLQVMVGVKEEKIKILIDLSGASAKKCQINIPIASIIQQCISL